MLSDARDAEIAGQNYRRQLRGWLSYSFACEVFAIVSLTLFLPVCLEQFARDNGFFEPDRTESCGVKGGVVPKADDLRQCVVKIGWVWIDTASFSLYVNSISVAIQALTVISIGGLADRPAQRKVLLLSFAAMGSMSSMLFLPLPSSSPVWVLVALLAILANVCFGASIVANNAYLPGLARESFEVVEARQAMLQDEGASGTVDEVIEENDDAGAPLLAGQHPNPGVAKSSRQEYEKVLSLATARLSSLGIALGYSAGIMLLLLALIPVILLKGSTFSLRIAIASSGIWWALFSIPASLWLPSGSVSDRSASKLKIGKEIGAAWKRLGHMLRWREIKSLGYTFTYLAAWFLLSDGFTTITSTAILFAKTVLHMPAFGLILIGALAPTFGIIGSLVFPRIQRAFHLSNLTVMVMLTIGVSLIPLYGCLGFIPFFRDGKAKFGGLTTHAEMYVLAVFFGSLYGAFQGYARAVFSELVPQGEEARWFALFSITDKSSSFLGPLVVGLIADLTGNIRYGFFFLAAMVWAAIPFLLAINMPKGREDAQAYTAKSLEQVDQH